MGFRRLENHRRLLEPSAVRDDGKRVSVLQLLQLREALRYNNPHVHTDSFLSGVYYVQVGPRPRGGGGEHAGSTLVLSDPRVQLQQFEYFDWCAASIPPAPSRLPARAAPHRCISSAGTGWACSVG